MALGDYKLWPLWVWIYCVVWWWIQDVCKVGAYWLMHRFNIFQVNTASLVNVRDQTTFGDKGSLARASAAAVEEKLLERQIDRAAETVARAADKAPEMRRASQDLALVRSSVRVARQSMGAGGAAVKDAETGQAVTAAESLRRMQATIAQIEALSRLAPESERAAIAAQLEAVRVTAERMSAIDAQMSAEKGGAKKSKGGN
jgi:H+-transporting ATPase